LMIVPTSHGGLTELPEVKAKSNSVLHKGDAKKGRNDERNSFQKLNISRT